MVATADAEPGRSAAPDGGGEAPAAGADDGVLTVAAVARRLGVAPATLRTWDRRYGLGPSEHAAGAHRRYSVRDVERLLVMRRLTIDGVAPAEAARLALSSTAPGGAGTNPGSDDLTARLPGASVTPTAPVPLGANRVDELVDAALTGRGDRCAAIVALTDADDVTRWWSVLVEPAFVALARRTVVDRPGVDARRTLVGAVLGALRARTASAPAPGAPVVLLLSVPGETRGVLAHVLAAALVDGGVDARLVAGPLSPRHAGELALMTRAAAVVTLAEGTAPDLSTVAVLARERPDLPQFVMVPEAAGDRVPLDRAVHRARTPAGLVHEALAAVAESSAL